MNYDQTISQTDLARNTDRVIRKAQRGCTILVENHGKPEVVIVDIVDFQLQRVALHYFRLPKEYEDDHDKSGGPGLVLFFNTSTDGFRK